jgi:helix-turn-helix protein
MHKKKKAPFKIIADAPAFRDRLGELTGNELKVWMYFWLTTAGELTAFPGNKTIASDLKIDVDTVKAAKKSLRAKGWTSRESQRVRDDGGLSTIVEKVHLPWGGNSTGGRGKISTEGVVEDSHLPMGEKLHQQKEDSFEVPLATLADSGLKQDSFEEVTDLPTNQSVVSDSVDESKTPTHKLETAATPKLGTEEKTKAKPTPEQNWAASSGYEASWGKWVSSDEIVDQMGECWSAYKTETPTGAEFNLFVEVLKKCDDNTCCPHELIDYAKTHMPPKLIGGLRSVKGLHNAVCGDNVSTTNGLIAQYKDHFAAIADCWICLKKVKDILCGRCGKNSVFLLPDGSPSQYCKQCSALGTVKSNGQAKGFTAEEVEYERTHDGNGNLIAVGTGFDVEEA